MVNNPNTVNSMRGGLPCLDSLWLRVAAQAYLRFIKYSNGLVPKHTNLGAKPSEYFMNRQAR